jgi:hypothetical protein
MRKTLLLAPLAALVLHASAARADEPAPPSIAAPDEVSHRYGLETFAFDGAAAAMTLASSVAGSGTLGEGLGLGALATYVLGGPAVHWAHGHVGKGFADLGLRVGVPALAGFVGGVIAAAAYEPPPPRPQPQATDLGQAVGQSVGDAVGDSVARTLAPLEGFVVGAFVGAGLASAADALLLARETRPVRRPEAAAVSWTPTVAAAPAGVRAGFSGTF